MSGHSVPPGLHLVVDVSNADATILRSASVDEVESRQLKPPFLDPSRRYRFDERFTELILEVRDGRNQVLDSFGLPWRAESFFEQPHESIDGGLRGGRQYYTQGPRLIEVPLRSEAAFLRFARFDVAADAVERGVSDTTLAVYALRPPDPNAPPPLIGGIAVTPRALPGPARLAEVD